MNYLHGDYGYQKGLLKKKKKKERKHQLVIWFRQMRLGNAFMLVSENDVPHLSKDASVLGESQLPVCSPLCFLLSAVPFLPPFLSPLTGQGTG